MSFNVALSGLNAASTELEVTGNNIANSATNGFKQSRVEFGDVYAATLYDTGTENAGGGVEVGRVAQQFDQGTVEFTSNNLDLAISGTGFFVVEDADGTNQYTRAGAYAANKDGFVVNSDNQKLQVYAEETSADGVVTYNTRELIDLQLPNTPDAPKGTDKVDLAVNLDAQSEVPATAFDQDVPDSYNHSTSFTVYDSVGTAHTATTYYRKTSDNTWDSYLYIGNELADGGGVDGQVSLSFSDTGKLTTTPSTISFDSPTLANGATIGKDDGTGTYKITVDITGTTQYGSDFSVNSVGQDGYASGRLTGVNINEQGEVFANYTNGQSKSLGKVALARFPDQQGLRPVGGSNWVVTSASGEPILGEAGTSTFGIVNSGALEASNVDIAEQLVKLITAQRNFQANTEVISSMDQLTQNIINIR